MFLSYEELVQLTNKKRRDAQRRVLIAMKIEHAVRPDGSLVVLRARLEKVLGMKNTAPAHTTEPNWDALASFNRSSLKKKST